MLTTSLALPPPGTGDCTMTQHRDPATGEYSVTIDQADPRILISDDLLAALAAPPTGNWPAAQRNAVLTCRGDITCCGDCARQNDWAGAVLRIYGANRTVIYRITRRHDEHTYIGEWPD